MLSLLAQSANPVPHPTNPRTTTHRAQIGKGTTAAEKKGGMRLAATFLEDTHRRAATTPVTRLMESGETAAFKSYFATWDPPFVAPDFGRRPSSGVAAAASAEAQGADASAVATMAAAARAEEEEGEVGGDDGGGEVKVWRVENLELAELPPEQHGHFYGGDSYVVVRA